MLYSAKYNCKRAFIHKNENDKVFTSEILAGGQKENLCSESLEQEYVAFSNSLYPHWGFVGLKTLWLFQVYPKTLSSVSDFQQ